MILSLVVPLAFALQDGDRVVFYGDSITEQRLYTTYVEVFVRTRYPKLKVDFFNAGVGGDTTWGGWTGDPTLRIKRDVTPNRPTRITIMLGMNDAGYVPFESKIETIFVEWYEKLLAEMKKSNRNVKFTLIQTSPFDDFTNRQSPFAGYNETLLKYGSHVKQLAAKGGHEYVDFNQPVVDAVKKALDAEPAIAASIVPDQIHPGPAGHLVMAAELLKTWGATPVVSKVRLDAKSSRVIEAVSTKATDFDKLKWTQNDESLPFPYDEEMAKAVRLTDFESKLNQQVLQVDNLESGSYELIISGEKVAVFSSDELAKGVNLAPLNTPMRKQALRVLELANKRNEVAISEWRMSFMMEEFSKTPKVAATLRELTNEVDIAERKASTPKPQTYELKKLAK